MVDCPPLRARWFFALDDGWQTFSEEDDATLEEQWAARDDSWAQEREKWVEEEKAKDAAAPPTGVDAVKNAIVTFVNTQEEKSSGRAKDNDGNEEDSAAKNEESRKLVNEHLDPDGDASQRKYRVAVMEDKLFDVDLVRMHLLPVFWKGVLLKVIRANWFYVTGESKYAPIAYDEGLAKDLDEAYMKVQPWKRQWDKDGEEKTEVKDDDDTLYPLPSMHNKGQIHFEGPESGKIYTQDLLGHVQGILGGSLVVRGWEETKRRTQSDKEEKNFAETWLPWAGGSDPEANDEAQNPSKRAQKKTGAAEAPSRAQSSSEGGQGESKEDSNEGFIGKLWPSSDALMRPHVRFLQAIGWSKSDAIDEEKRGARQKNTEKSLRTERNNNEVEEEDSEDEEDEDDGEIDENGEQGKNQEISDDRADEPPELVLIVHGIGQKLTEDFDAIDFVYDVERFRNLSKTVAGNKAMRRVSRGKRAQFLPICWRKELNFDDSEAAHGCDNVYGLKDVSNNASIPLVRNVISKVILDVPYYLSRHKTKMIDAVKSELNRVYRLFVKRNPDFEKRGGRVSLICHSLGSSLASDILSAQPTVVPLVQDEKDHEAIRSNKHLLFNVKNLFFVGSPNGFFFHLHGAQLIARRGNARTKDVADDAASDEVGRYGCMAAESIYNCYNLTDPVAYQLSATVDAPYARLLRPISIPDAVPALLESLALPRLSISKLFDEAHPFSDKSTAYALHRAQELPSAVKTSLSPSAAGEERPTFQSASGNATPERGRHSASLNVVLEEGTKQKEAQPREKVKGVESKIGEKMNLARLERAERRFRALNPHGCIDFTYSSQNINQYLDMLGAHVSYWQSPSFSTFVLTQLFAGPEPAAKEGDDNKDGEGKERGTEDRVPTIVPDLVVEEPKKKATDKKEDDGNQPGGEHGDAQEEQS